MVYGVPWASSLLSLVVPFPGNGGWCPSLRFFMFMVSCDPSLNDASGALDDVLEVRRPPSRTSQKTSTEKLVIHDGLAEDALFFPSLAETPKLGVCVQRSAMNDTDILRVCKVLSRVVVNQVCDVKNLFAENTETWNRADTWHKKFHTNLGESLHDDVQPFDEPFAERVQH